MSQRFLDPAVLAGISGLDLVAKTVVDGFVAGLHRSPDFGFSQEFAEYRAYTPGDDLRHVDWNVFARTERAYLKRYRGETNSLLTVLLDASQSMEYASHARQQAGLRALHRRVAVLSGHPHQRDAAGLIVFDDEVRNYIRPSTRQGQLRGCCSGLEQAEPRARTDFAKPFAPFSGVPAPARPGRDRFRFLRVARTRSSRPSSRCASTATRWSCFTSSIRRRSRPKLPRARRARGPGDADQQMEVTPDYAQRRIPRQDGRAPRRPRARAARGAGMDYFLLHDRPAARRRAARISGHPAGGDCRWDFSLPGFWRASRRWACRSICTCCGGTRRRRGRSAR